MGKFPSEAIFLHSSECMVGDVIIGYLHNVKKEIIPREIFERQATGIDRRVVTKIDARYVYVVVESNLDIARGYEDPYINVDGFTYAVVIRDVQRQRQIGEYPHLCPRCNQPAYVGLVRVSHRNGRGDCPAP